MFLVFLTGSVATVVFSRVASAESDPSKCFTQLTTDPAKDGEPSWSHDGKKIIFVSTRDHSHPDIWVMDADGNNEKLLIGGNDSYRNPSYKPPDDSKILFTKSHGDGSWIWTMDPDTSGQERIVFDPYYNFYQPCWSPDGNKIAYQCSFWFYPEDDEIYILNYSDRTVTQLTLTDYDVDDECPTWSPDGSKIAFVSNRSGESHIWIMNSDRTGTPIDMQVCGIMPKWSPVDADKIAFTFISTKSENVDLWLLTNTQEVIAGGEPKIVQLTKDSANDGGEGFAWSPDGNEIVFSSDRNGNFDIWMLDMGCVLIEQAGTPTSTSTPEKVLDVSISANPPVIHRNEVAILTVIVTSEGMPVEGANVLLYGEYKDDAIPRASRSFTYGKGKTNSSGIFKTTWSSTAYSSATGKTMHGYVLFKALVFKLGFVNGSGTVGITQKPSPAVLEVSISANPSIIHSDESTNLTIIVTSDGIPVEGADVYLSAAEGLLIPVSIGKGKTNSSGIFTLPYSPSGAFRKNISITAEAYKLHYVTGSNTVMITVNPPATSQPSSVYMGAILIVIVLLILIVFLFTRDAQLYRTKLINFLRKKSPKSIFVIGTIAILVSAVLFGTVCDEFIIGFFGFLMVTGFAFYQYVWLYKKAWSERQKICWRSPGGIAVIGSFIIPILAVISGDLNFQTVYEGVATVMSWTFFYIYWYLSVGVYAQVYKKAWREGQKIYWRSPGGIAVIGSFIISILAIITGFQQAPHDRVLVIVWIFYLIVLYLSIGVYWHRGNWKGQYHLIKVLKKSEEYSNATGSITRINIPKIAYEQGINIRNIKKTLKTIEWYIAQKYLLGWIDYRISDYVYIPGEKTEDLEKYILRIDKREKIYESLFYNPKIGPFRQKQTVNEYIINTVKDTLSKFIISANARSRGLNDTTQTFNINTLHDLGKNMSHYFTENMLNTLFNETSGYLQINTTLLSIPWELVWYNKEFLFEKHINYRMFPMHEKVEAKTDFTYPIKCLYISDPTKSLKHEFVERSYMEDVIKQMPALKGRIKIDVVDDMTANEFKNILIKGKYDIIHYTGHGAYRAHLKEPVIYFKQSTLKPSDIPDIKRAPKIIIFNACITAKEEDIEFYAEIHKGFAQVFVEKGVNSFIGTLWPIRDYAAGKFARAFYKNLFINNLSIASSLTQIKKEYCNDPDSFDITGYVLYSSNPTWRLIERKKS